MRVCLWLSSEPEKPKQHISHQNLKNRSIFAKKTETATDNKTGRKNRKTDLENGQNRKTENRSNAPLDKQSEFLSFTKIYIPFYCSRSGRSLSLENRRSCLTVSKALLKSIANTLTALNPFWSKNVRIWCYIVNGASVQLPPFLLGNCLLSTM